MQEQYNNMLEQLRRQPDAPHPNQYYNNPYYFGYQEQQGSDPAPSDYQYVTVTIPDIVKCILLCYFVLFCKYNSFYISSGDIGTSVFLTININSLLFTTNRP